MKYDKFNYTTKFKSSLIQTGLQTPNNLSSLLYLGDIYNVTSVIHIDSLKKKVNVVRNALLIFYIKMEHLQL